MGTDCGNEHPDLEAWAPVAFEKRSWIEAGVVRGGSLFVRMEA